VRPRQPPTNFKEKGTCPNMTLRCAIQAGEGIRFSTVNVSATILCMRNGISLTIPVLANSRTRYRQISMCREEFLRTGVSLIVMYAKLSSKMSVTADCWYPKSRIASRRFTTFWAAWLAATNFKSKEKHYLVSNFQSFQEIGSQFNNKM